MPNCHVRIGLTTECLNTRNISEDRRIQLCKAFEGIWNIFKYFIYLTTLIMLSIYKLISSLIYCYMTFNISLFWKAHETNKVCMYLLSSSSSRLQHVANAGMLIILCLRLRHLLWEKGQRDVWCDLRKIASAIRCLPGSDSKCLCFLQSEDHAQEREIDSSVFQ